MAAVAVFGLLAAVSLPSAQGRASETTLPEIGVTYTHASIPSGCDLTAARALVKTYDWPGTRRRAQLQLAAMRAAGVDSLVMFLWHLSEPASNDLNNIPSAGGRIREPFRTNLINYVTDIRAAGFKSLTVNWGPQWTNNPLGDWQPNGVVNDIWDPQKLDENWSFIRDTRTLVKRYGPGETWFDPTMEMAPSDYVEQRLPGRLDGYIAEIYRRYAEAFGKDDLIFTVIGKSPEARVTTTERMGNLIRILRSTGLGMPPRFGVHPDQSSPTIGMKAADDTLRSNGVSQPLVIGEMVAEGPSSTSAARDIVNFARNSGRLVPQVHLWWWRSEFEPHECLSPPYRADSYISAFTGSPVPSTLSATVRGATVDFRTAYGQPVTALTAGIYPITVRDASGSANFHLVGPRVDKKTGMRAKGSAAWSVTLSPGVYRFGSDSAPSELKKVTVFRTG